MQKRYARGLQRQRRKHTVISSNQAADDREERNVENENSEESKEACHVKEQNDKALSAAAQNVLSYNATQHNET